MDIRVIAVIGGIVLLWVVAGVGLFLYSRRQSPVEQRLGQFTGAVQEIATTAKPKEQTKKVTIPLSEQVSQIFAGRKFAEGMTRDLARADVKLNVAEYLGAHGVAAAVVGFVGYWFIGQRFPGIHTGIGLLDALFPVVAPTVATVGGGIVGLFLPGMYVRYLQGTRLATFDTQLGDMLNLVVNGLRAGFSVMQALEAVGKELPPPISVEFKRVVQEMQLGLPMEQALANLTRRIPSKDLDFVVTAINVQREVGGNLAEILDTITYTIRERVRIRGEISTLTAQGMITGYVISFLPIGLGVFLYLINPTYMMQVFGSDYSLFGVIPGPVCGAIMVITALLLIGIGFAAVMKIVQIEV